MEDTELAQLRPGQQILVRGYHWVDGRLIDERPDTVRRLTARHIVTESGSHYSRRTGTLGGAGAPEAPTYRIHMICDVRHPLD